MTSPEDYCTLDGDSSSIAPYRPDVDDVGGAEWVNDQAYPPIPSEMLTAADARQMAKLIVRACRMMPALKFSITYTTTNTPVVTGFACANDSLEIGDFAVTNPSSGVTRIEWTAGTLPPSRTRPTLTVNSAGVFQASVTQAANVITVTTLDDADAEVEASFTVEVDGE